MKDCEKYPKGDTAEGSDKYLTQQDVTLDQPSDEADFDGVSVGFLRFDEAEDGSFQEFKDEKEEAAQHKK